MGSVHNQVWKGTHISTISTLLHICGVIPTRQSPETPRKCQYRHAERRYRRTEWQVFHDVLRVFHVLLVVHDVLLVVHNVLQVFHDLLCLTMFYNV